MYYTQKNHLVEVERVDEGMLLTNELGNSFTVSEEWFYENYVQVKKMRKKPSKPSIDDLASAYREIGELVKESNENNEDYIFDTKMKVDKAV